MSEKVKKIRVKQADGTMSDYIHLGANADFSISPNDEVILLLAESTWTPL